MRPVLLACVLLSAGMVAGCTGQGDGDGLSADVEGNGWLVRATYPNQTVREYHVTSDPAVADTDGDGLNDFQELQESADPRNIDTDRDRLADGPKLCPQAGTELAQKALDRNLLPHPTDDGCYVGESSWRYDGTTINTKPTDAHSDNSVRIGDNLTDSEELIGWNVTPVGGESYHVFSNPSTQSPDSDGDGLHDGLEKQLELDPRNRDTDDDGVEDLRDAAPLGNLILTAKLTKINLKQGKKVTGGADLLMQVGMGGSTKTAGPNSIPNGRSEPRMSLTFDVPDQGTDFGGGAAAGNYQVDVYFTFVHDQTGNGEVDDNDEPIRVKSSGDNQHTLSMRYSAFDDTWGGDASGGTSSGPDADVTVDLSMRIE